MFYDKFKALCDKKGITPTAAGRAIVIPQPTIAEWKKQGTTPRPKTLFAIAKNFKVKPESLLEEKQ